MDETFVAYDAMVYVVRQVLFWAAVVLALVALVDWLVRTRRIQPFGPIARFFRRYIDPLMVPIERRLLRSGGQPAHAPWWALGIVVVGGLVLITLLNVVRDVVISVYVGASTPGGIFRLAVAWAFTILRIALIVRVLSSWVQISPYSKWIRWSFTLTEWMLRPLRRVIPAFGPVDVTPIVAFLLLALLQGIVGRAL